jgi:hypothetical protein
VLREIYDRHYDDFVSEAKRAGRSAVILVPLGIPEIAKRFGVSPDSVFGRLYYHLDRIYGGEVKPGEARKVFFTQRAGDDANCVNFPFLEAVLAGLWQQRNRDRWTIWLALVSLIIALASLGVAIVALTQ